eukprot:910080-Amphidinium_carterae.1
MEDVLMSKESDQKIQACEYTLRETDHGMILKVAEPSGALCACLHGMGFTHMKEVDGNLAEFRTQHCFLPGTEETEQTPWLSSREERHIMDQLAASASAEVEEEEPADDADEIVLPD